VTAQPRPPDGHEQDGSERDAHEHGAACARLVEQRLGERGPELHGARRQENHGNGWHGGTVAARGRRHSAATPSFVLRTADR
jgi:hypothetical protein